MKTLAVIVDSFTGISKKEAEKKGFYFIPQKVLIDGKEYEDGIDFSTKKNIDDIMSAKDAKTSQPSVGKLEELFKKLSKSYDNVIMIPAAIAMSSGYSTAKALSKDFNNVYVVNPKLTGAGIVEAAERAVKMAEAGKDVEIIVKMVERLADSFQQFVIIKNLDRLIASGRLSGAKKFVMQKASLIPRLQVTDEGFKTTAVKRNFNKSITSAVEKLVEIVGEKNIDMYTFNIASTNDEYTDSLVAEAFNKYGIKDFTVTPTPGGVALHTGKGSVGIGAWKKER